MPKRIIDGEALWRSDKLSQIEPVQYRAEYANLYPLAYANGVFEFNTRRVWSEVYSYNRPDRSVEDVEKIFTEFERVKIAFRWTDTTGRTYVYWVGSSKPGRLPREPWRERDAARGKLPPDPPVEALRQFLGEAADRTEPQIGCSRQTKAATKYTGLVLRLTSDEVSELQREFGESVTKEFSRLDLWLMQHPGRRPENYYELVRERLVQAGGGRNL